MAVVGAKLSEGLNFTDDLARAVVMVGLPYPNASSPELKERLKYVSDLSKQKGDTGDAGRELYENLCMNAVNQSIGAGYFLSLSFQLRGPLLTLSIGRPRNQTPERLGRLGFGRHSVLVTPNPRQVTELDFVRCQGHQHVRSDHEDIGRILQGQAIIDSNESLACLQIFTRGSMALGACIFVATTRTGKVVGMTVEIFSVTTFRGIYK